MRSIASMPLTALLLLLACTSVFSQGAAPVRSREAFAVAMAKIQISMPENEVLAILGPPDDIRTQFDPGGISRNAKEVWCYGTQGHLSFPTLGCVFIDNSNRVQDVLGGKGRPPESGLFKEDELQRLLRLLDTSPGLFGANANPLTLIQTANTLKALGKDKALAAIAEYVRVADPWAEFGDRYRPYSVLLVLFNFPDNVDPGKAGGFGAIIPSRPQDPHLMPRFPIVIVDGIPLLLIQGDMLAGVATPMEKILDFFRTNGLFCPQPLVPGNDPLAALNDLLNSRQWIYDDNWTEKAILREQLLRLIDSVYRLPVDERGNRLPYENPEPVWEKIRADASRLKIKWDPQQQMYVFANGRHLPPLPHKIYRRVIWHPADTGVDDIELILERKSSDGVDAELNLSGMANAKFKTGSLNFYPAGSNQASLNEITFTKTEGDTYWSLGFRLKDGADVRAVLVLDGCRTNSSPIFKP